MELIGLEKRLLGLAATLLLGLLLSVCNSSPGTVVGQSAVGVGEGGAAGGAGAGGGTGR